MKNWIYLFTLGLIALFSTRASAQNSVVFRPIPKNAAIYSAVIPGLGQAYNRKYWKVPLVYAAMGTSLYFLIQNQHQFKRYVNAYKAVVDEDSTTVDEFQGRYSGDQIMPVLEYYRKNRDLSAILLGLSYALNIVDAFVDAHLYEFKIDDNISLKVEPGLINNYATKTLNPSLSFRLNF